MLPALRQKVEEPLRMKRQARLIHKTAYAVLLGFRRVLATQLRKPTGCAGGFIHIKLARAKNGAGSDLPVLSNHHLSLGVQLTQSSQQAFGALLVKQVCLGNHYHIAKFDLIDQQISDVAFIFFGDLHALFF